MNLRLLFQTLPQTRWLGPAGADPDITSITLDSREARPGALFVAVNGTRQDGRRFIADAVRRGARAVVSEPGESGASGVPHALVPDVREALPHLAGALYGNPSARLNLVGVTGTNGKTTTAYLIESILRRTGGGCGLLSTIEYHVGARVSPSTLTTPQAHDLQCWFDEMLRNGDRYCVMEVSSHALALHRVDQVQFRAGLFTNLSQDHLDYHKDMETYFQAKCRLFDGLGSRPDAFAVVHTGDVWGRRLLERLKVPAVTVGLDAESQVHPRHWTAGPEGVRVTVQSPSGSLELESALRGQVNVNNLLMAAACCLQLGVDPEVVRDGVLALKAVPGRMEFVGKGLPFAVIVDYAHTPEALRSLLQGVRALGFKRVTTVFGCGGDRDALKRPIMGGIALRLSDRVIVTSDNPRREDPRQIIAQVISGSPEAFSTVEDRRLAIQEALASARPGDAVVVAGKGHEDYQILGERRVHFSDREVCAEILERLFPGSSGGRD